MRHIATTGRVLLLASGRWHLRWRADNSYTNTQQWTGAAWENASWDFTGDVYRSGDFVELRIPMDNAGSPDPLEVLMYMINETASAGWSCAGTPDKAFTDGYDPDPVNYFEFDIGGALPPASHTAD